jgi:glutamate mutase epsilon subunit
LAARVTLKQAYLLHLRAFLMLLTRAFARRGLLLHVTAGKSTITTAIEILSMFYDYPCDWCATTTDNHVRNNHAIEAL